MRGWGQVVARLGLLPERYGGGTLTYRGEVWGFSLRVSFEVAQQDGPVQVEVGEPRPAEDAAGAEWVALPAFAVLVPPAVRTGDARFDGLVAMVIGGEHLLPWLDTRTRGRLALAIARGAAVTNRSSALAAARDLDEEQATAAVEMLLDSRRAVREAHAVPLVRRWLAPDAAPAVRDAVFRALERDGHALSAADAEDLVRQLVERGEDPDLRLVELIQHRPVQVALARVHPESRLLREQLDASVQAGDPQLAVDVFCARLAAGVVEGLPWFAVFPSHPSVIAAVLDAHRDRPGTVNDLLLQLDPNVPRVVERLAAALATLDHPQALRRLTQLIQRAPEPVGTAIVERVRRELAAGRSRELDDLSPYLVNAWLFRGLLALPDEAAPWLASLEPREEDRRIELVRRLQGCTGPEVEEHLLRAVQHASLPLRRAAARGLAESGGRRSLGALVELADGWLVDADLRAAAKASVARIRERHAAGGLSESSEGGALSEPRADGGLSRPRR